MSRSGGPDRRRVLAGMAGAAGLLATGRPAVRAARAAAPYRGRRPKSIVYLLLFGGIDGLLTTDPKLGKEIGPRIHRGYEDGAIRTRDGYRFGPAWGGLGDHAARMAIVNGVDCGTVAHPYGIEQVRQGRRLWPTESRRGLLEILAAHAPAPTPLSSVHFTAGMVLNDDFAPPSGQTLVVDYRHATGRDPLNGGLIPRLHRLSKAPSRAAFERALRESASAPDASRAVQAVLERMARAELGAPPDPSPQNVAAARAAPYLAAADVVTHTAEFQSIVRDTIFLLETQLTRSIFLNIRPLRAGWDSHEYNWENQHQSTSLFAIGLDMLFRELDAHQLTDEVAVVISSEIGRHPYLNQRKGKDHFPQHPVIFCGPGVRPGQYGSTGERTESRSISFSTGRASTDPLARCPATDDIGATILHWFGHADPVSLGYLGDRLDFVLA